MFTRPSFVPAELDGVQTHCIAPAIDPTATKNRSLPPHLVAELARGMGVVRGDPRASTWVAPAEVISDGAPPRLGVEPIVLSLCRWDRLKDPAGIVDAFADTIAARTSAHLLLAGPAVGGVEDDPESADVFRTVLARWSGLSIEHRRRVHVVCLPLADVERNAAMVNVLQHIADVVVKKSRAEGFGLGVTEAMWKGRGVVATAVGGQKDQVEHGRTGPLVDDPDDLVNFGAAVVDLLRHRTFAARLGHAGRDKLRSRFLPVTTSSRGRGSSSRCWARPDLRQHRPAADRARCGTRIRGFPPQTPVVGADAGTDVERHQRAASSVYGTSTTFPFDAAPSSSSCACRASDNGSRSATTGWMSP